MQNRSTVAVFVDVKSAFDNVVPSILIEDFIQAGFPLKFCKFVQNLISQRNVQFVIQGKLTNIFTSRKDTPQGSVLSPNLFNFYLRKLGSACHHRTQILQYADDIVIYSSFSSIERARKSVEISLNSINSFLISKGLEISPEKTQMMSFRHSLGTADNNLHISLGNKIICSSSPVKFLGVLLDPKLQGRKHLNGIIAKTRKIADIITSLRGVWWGSHPQLLLNIYRSTLRSVVEFASHIFPTENSPQFQKLKIIQNKAIRSSLGYRNSIPINVMLAEAREPPLNQRLDYLASKYLIRSLSIREHPIITKLELLTYLAINDSDNQLPL